MKEFTCGLFRGPRPKSLEELKANKITTIIDLETGAYEKFHNDWYETAGHELWENGINLIRFPLFDIWPPNRYQICWIFAEIDKASLRPGSILIHCKSGVDRTGFVVAAWRMYRQKWSLAAAANEWIMEGAHWWFCW